MYKKLDNTEQTERNAVIVRQYQKGYTYKEIAKHVGVTRSTIAGVVSRNKRKLANATNNL